MSKPSRIVVVGAGHLGTYHLQKLSANPEANLVAAVDTSAEACDRARARFDIPVGENLDMFACDADGVVIAAPTVHHRKLAEEAFAAGLHVLVEKPLAATVDDAQAIVDAAKFSGRILQVGHTERFNPAVAAALRILDRPGYIVAERLGPFSGRSVDIDVVFDLMIHDLDIVAALVVAPLREVRAVGVPVFSAEVDMASARLEFSDGAVAQLSASRGSLEPSRKIRIFTQERYLSIDCQSREVKSVRRRLVTAEDNGASTPPRLELAGETIDVPEADPLALQDSGFLRCIREGSRPRVDGEAGLRAVKLANAVTDALTTPL